MDVLKPEVIYIKGRCFRINPINVNLNDDSASQKNWTGYKNTYEEDCTVDFSNEEDEEQSSQCPIEIINGERYKAAFHVARAYFPYIIGSKAATRKRLEHETKTQINVPKFGHEGDIVIIGTSKNGIQSCYRRINMIVMTVRRKQQYTHFISIPFTGEQIKKRFLEFKREVLDQFKDCRGVSENIFQSSDKLHLTLCTLVLSDDVERKNAITILQNCKRNVVDKVLEGLNSLTMRVRGIEIMNDDPSEVNVLYGKVECENNCLQTLCDNIVEYCANSGIIEKQYETVKLHITLMNTKFVKSSSENSLNRNNKNKRNSITLNALPILKVFENYDFGEETINGIHLSQMATISDSGYYKPSFIIALS